MRRCLVDLEPMSTLRSFYKFTASSKDLEALVKFIEHYKQVYPDNAYMTTVSDVDQSGDTHFAVIERLKSCD